MTSIRRRDSNPRPSEHESPPITTRPGLPSYLSQVSSIHHLHRRTKLVNYEPNYRARRERHYSSRAEQIKTASGTFGCTVNPSKVASMDLIDNGRPSSIRFQAVFSCEVKFTISV